MEEHDKTKKSRRGNGFGTLISKGQGKPWLARWRHNGRIYTKSTGERDKRLALKELERLTRPFREDSEVAVLRSLEARVRAAGDKRVESNDMELSALGERFAESLCAKDLAPGTLKHYLFFINDMVTWMSESKVQKMKEIDKKLAEKYLLYLDSKVCPAAWNMHLVFLKKLWRMFKEEAGLEENAWESFKKKKVSKVSSRRSFTQAELERLLEAASGDKCITLLLALGVYTGMRLGDCAMLKWESVDFSAMVLRVLPMKVKRHLSGPVEIPIHSSLCKVLESWLPERDMNGGWVCKENAEGYLSKRVGAKLAKLFKDCGIVTSEEDESGKRKLVAGFHSLRHTFVSMAVNGGVSPMLVRKIVGHSCVDMTARYWHEEEEAAREGIAQLPDFIDAESSVVASPEKKPKMLSEEGLSMLIDAFKEEDVTLDGTIKRLVGLALPEISEASA